MSAIDRETRAMFPFFVAMIGAISFFVWQIVEYTTFLG